MITLNILNSSTSSVRTTVVPSWTFLDWSADESKTEKDVTFTLDESAWSALYTNTSIPFEKPSKGKIAVKVINHYGDEVLKVYEVE